ncbi:unnamed protein product [Phytophthora lilii]|uniref:Unnamed protein product n=1 Tax=Phytophthora lilii TaxID=2077276 RepID=A0A9W6U2M0_9STRA|nr:unnamed protein product [Phytophthora lilii]
METVAYKRVICHWTQLQHHLNLTCTCLPHSDPSFHKLTRKTQGCMPSFPASKYARYKCATAFFLDWLLRARGRGRHASKRVGLETLTDVVLDIAARSETLTPKLLQELPKALTACQCAVTLREHVSAFLGDEEKGHQHFLTLLRRWLDALKMIDVSQQQKTMPESSTSQNYYEVLQVDEDYFPDEQTLVTDKGLPTKAKMDRKSCSTRHLKKI